MCLRFETIFHELIRKQVIDFSQLNKIIISSPLDLVVMRKSFKTYRM